MSISAGSRLAPPQFLHDEAQHRRLIGGWIQQAHQGHLANVGIVTLTINALSTSVADARAGATSFIGFMPTTANAATELGTLYVQTRNAESFVITHTSAATADRTYIYCLLG